MTKTTKTIIGITSALFVGVAGYFVWRGIKNSKDARQLNKDIKDLNNRGEELKITTNNNGQTTTTTETTTTQTTTPPKPGDQTFIGPVQPSGSGGVQTNSQGNQIYKPPTLTYPIMFGQKGDNVKKLQQMLLQYDKTLLPKYGADGDFGMETSTALNKVLGNAILRNEADTNVIANKINQRLILSLAMVIR